MCCNTSEFSSDLKNAFIRYYLCLGSLGSKNVIANDVLSYDFCLASIGSAVSNCNIN